MMNKPSHQKGFSLLEALIAVLVLAIGLLGVAGLNLLGLRGAQDSSARSVATQLAYEIADLIRANPTATANYINAAVINTAAAPAKDCFSAACSASELASFDLITWARSIDNPSLGAAERARQSKLPSGQAVICRDKTPDDGTPAAVACTGAAADPVVVKIWWNERAVNNTEATAAGGATVQRRFAMVILP